MHWIVQMEQHGKFFLEKQRKEKERKIDKYYYYK